MTKGGAREGAGRKAGRKLTTHAYTLLPEHTAHVARVQEERGLRSASEALRAIITEHAASLAAQEEGPKMQTQMTKQLRADLDAATWTTPPECQGQIVEASYAWIEEGPVKRVTDHSDGEVRYYIGREARLAEWDPINTIPTGYDWWAVTLQLSSYCAYCGSEHGEMAIGSAGVWLCAECLAEDDEPGEAEECEEE